VLRRFAEFHDLQGAFGRRALTEPAKGILMERHDIDDKGAFEMLRDRSRVDNHKLIDLAAVVVDGHRLLPKQPKPSPSPDGMSEFPEARSARRSGRFEDLLELPGYVWFAHTPPHPSSASTTGRVAVGVEVGGRAVVGDAGREGSGAQKRHRGLVTS
jgi:hypothetical protein